jgi:hypothetical protein
MRSLSFLGAACIGSFLFTDPTAAWSFAVALGTLQCPWICDGSSLKRSSQAVTQSFKPKPSNSRIRRWSYDVFQPLGATCIGSFGCHVPSLEFSLYLRNIASDRNAFGGSQLSKRNSQACAG